MNHTGHLDQQQANSQSTAERDGIQLAVPPLMYSRVPAEEAYSRLGQRDCPFVDIATLEDWCHFSPLQMAAQPEQYEKEIRTHLARNGLTAVACNMGGLPREDSEQACKLWDAYLRIL